MLSDELRRIGRRLHRAHQRPTLNHEELETILADLTNLTAAVTSLEAAEAAVATEIGVLKSNDDQAGVDTLTARIQTVVTELQGFIPPPPPEPVA